MLNRNRRWNILNEDTTIQMNDFVTDNDNLDIHNSEI
jgi:hypothetical protein